MPLLATFILSGCGKEEVEKIDPEPNAPTAQKVEPKKDDEQPKPPAEAPPLKPETTTDGALKNALVASSVQVDREYYAQTGILVNPPNTTSSPINASGFKTGLVLFPRLNLKRQTIGNNARQLGDKGLFSKPIYLGGQLSDPTEHFEILKVSSLKGERALSFSTEPPPITKGMNVTVYTTVSKTVPPTAAEEKNKEAKADLTILREEISQFLKDLESQDKASPVPQIARGAGTGRLNKNQSPWNRETTFISVPPGRLNAEQYKRYKGLRDRLITSRKLIPITDPMMRPNYGRVPSFGGSGESERPKEFDLIHFKSKITEKSDDNNRVIIAAGPDGLPDGLGFVVLGDNGHLIGLATREESGNLNLHSLEHLAGINEPSVISAEISISVSDQNEVKPRVKPKTRLGLDGWKSMWLAIVPTEEKLSFPAGDGADAIFNPTDRASKSRLSEISQSYETEIEYDDDVPIQPGTKISFTGQFFAKSSDGNEYYFDPFTFEVESAAVGKAFDIKMVSGPKYATVFDPDTSETTTSSKNTGIDGDHSLKNGTPAIIDFEGSLLASHLNGSNEILTIQTSAPPFIYTIDLKTQKKTSQKFEMDVEPMGSKILTAVSGNNLFVVNSGTTTAKKFELTTGELLSESKISNFDDPIQAIAAASANATSPLMIGTATEIRFFSPENFEELSPTLKNKGSKKDLIQDGVIQIPQTKSVLDVETPYHKAEISADGLSYLFNSVHSRNGSSIFMQPNANNSAFTVTTSETLDDLGFNGYMLRRRNNVKTGIDGESTRIDSKNTITASNKGGEGYFSIKASSSQSTRNYPNRPSTLGFHYIGKEAPIFETNLFPELKSFTRYNTSGSNVIFNQTTNQLITIPWVGEQLFIRELSDGISNQSEFLFTTGKNISIERGEKLEILISSIGNAESVQKTSGPEGSNFDPETSQFTWDIPQNFSKNETEIVFSAKIAEGSPVEHRIKVNLTGTPPAVLSKGLPYDSQERAPNFDSGAAQTGLVSQGIPLDAAFSEFIPTESGSRAVLTYYDSPRIDLIDLSKGEISARATLSSDVCLVTANHEAVFCYYPVHQIVERRNCETLEIEKTSPLQLKAPLRIFKTGYQSYDMSPIIGLTDTSNSREDDHHFVFIDPVNLTIETPTVTKNRIHASLRKARNNPLPVSENGDRFMFDAYIYQIHGASSNELLDLDSGYTPEYASISSIVDAAFIGGVQYLIPSGTKIDRKLRKLSFFNFSSSGDYVYGYGLSVTSDDGREALIEFFEPFSPEPLLSIYRLPELERNPHPRPEWQSGVHNGLVYHFESIHKLITLPRDHRSVVIRDLNISEAIKKLK